MSIGQSWAIALLGLEGHMVEVAADIAMGLPKTTLIGRPDATLSEARDRVRAAVTNSGETFPNRKLTLGLSPADLPKAGSHYDLAIACAVLAATEVLPAEALLRTVLVGELGLDGTVREAHGTLAMTVAAAQAGFGRIVVPELNAGEARLVPAITIFGVRSLRQVIAVLRGDEIPDEPPPRPAPRLRGGPHDRMPRSDLRDVIGQLDGRRAIEVAAAGGHNLFLKGPPGSGKTMLAERLPGLLPDLSTDDSLEVSALHSMAGVLPADGGLVTRPPFVAPHHSASLVSLVGGGSGQPRPGAISCAHRGTLFIDEAAEMHRQTLDALRSPLESGQVEVHRAGAVGRFPARFMLALAANPCPCGQYGARSVTCQCSRSDVHRYGMRISAPIRDRLDIHRDVRAESVRTTADLLAAASESTVEVAARVAEARDRQALRYLGCGARLNSDVPSGVLRREFPLAAPELELLEGLQAAGELTNRGVDRVARLAWTLADLAGVNRPDGDHVHEAIQLRTRRVLTARGETRDIRGVA